eukprot:COSAG06_NODE_5711_length_3310_cov_1.642790_3_plen_146_part_00
MSRRYRFETDAEIPAETKTKIAFALHDKMTEQIYDAPMESFLSVNIPDPVTHVPILAEGRAALDRINADWGLGMDEDDVKYYTGLFKDKMKRCAPAHTERSLHPNRPLSHVSLCYVAGIRQMSRCSTSASRTQNTAATGFSKARS